MDNMDKTLDDSNIQMDQDVCDQYLFVLILEIYLARVLMFSYRQKKNSSPNGG